MCVLALPVFASPLAGQAEGLASDRPTLNFMGTPGLVDMPSGIPLPDGDVTTALSYFGPNLRMVFNFQMSERLSGTFRYAVIEDFDSGTGPTGGGPDRPDYLKGARFDRSFDLRYLLFKEGRTMPSVTVGLRDFGGTGVYSGEFVVATKNVTPELQVTGGIGWGRLATHGGFKNPLGIFGSHFDNRPAPTNNTGQIDFGDWFRGDAALFGGIQYRPTRNWVLTAEYSSDSYPREQTNTSFEYNSPFNFSATYQADNGVDVTLAYLYGSNVGLMLSYDFNPKSPPGPQDGREKQGPLVVPRDAAALGWTDLPQDGAGAASPAVGGMQAAATQRLALEGIDLVAMEQHGNTVVVHLENRRYQAQAEAIGRAARALTAVLPPEVETMVLVPMNGPVAMSAVTLWRADLEELENDVDGSWKSFARAGIADARDYPVAMKAPGAFPRFTYGVDVYLGPTFSNPDSLVAEGGLRFDASYILAPGVLLSAELRQPVLANTGNPVNTDTPIPPVRTDAGLYDDGSNMRIQELTAAYFFRPADNVYGRMSMGYFERMYGGFSGEVLWKPVSGPLAVGLELNYAQKRATDGLLGWRDYNAVTGYASVYYDFGGGYMGQIDAGRYLAGDWGATFSMDREFDNGFMIGAYFTLTDVSSSDFGEGSFDKGIYFSIPLTWLLGEASTRTYAATWRPINGNGGARMQVPDRLYDFIRSGQASELQAGWGRFWR